MDFVSSGKGYTILPLKKAEENCTREHYSGSLSGGEATVTKQVTSERQVRKATTLLPSTGPMGSPLTLQLIDISVFHLVLFRAPKALLFPTNYSPVGNNSTDTGNPGCFVKEGRS